jgi:hypothetical protein
VSIVDARPVRLVAAIKDFFLAAVTAASSGVGITAGGGITGALGVENKPLIKIPHMVV